MIYFRDFNSLISIMEFFTIDTVCKDYWGFYNAKQ